MENGPLERSSTFQVKLVTSGPLAQTGITLASTNLSLGAHWDGPAIFIKIYYVITAYMTQVFTFRK